jgi:hypothetical protein
LKRPVHTTSYSTPSTGARCAMVVFVCATARVSDTSIIVPPRVCQLLMPLDQASRQSSMNDQRCLRTKWQSSAVIVPNRPETDPVTSFERRRSAPCWLFVVIACSVCGLSGWLQSRGVMTRPAAVEGICARASPRESQEFLAVMMGIAAGRDPHVMKRRGYRLHSTAFARQPNVEARSAGDTLLRNNHFNGANGVSSGVRRRPSPRAHSAISFRRANQTPSCAPAQRMKASAHGV